MHAASKPWWCACACVCFHRVSHVHACLLNLHHKASSAQPFDHGQQGAHPILRVNATSRQIHGGKVQVWIRCGWTVARRRRRVVVIRPTDSHRDTFKHDAIQGHAVGSFLDGSNFDESKLLFVVDVHVDDGVTNAAGVACNRMHSGSVHESGGRHLSAEQQCTGRCACNGTQFGVCA
jgi:hypothetical protein